VCAIALRIHPQAIVDPEKFLHTLTIGDVMRVAVCPESKQKIHLLAKRTKGEQLYSAALTHGQKIYFW
jgi:hypothetical protein